MAITDYPSLVTAVQTWLHRSDLAAQVPDFIALGELHLNAEVEAIGMQTTVTLPTVAGSRFAPLPSRLLEPLSLTWQDNELLLATSGSLEQAAANVGAGRPSFYAATDQMEFDCIADQAYQLRMVYRKSLNLLADATNWLITQAPSAYLYAALSEAAPYIVDLNQVSLWTAKRDEAIKRVNAATKRRKVTTLRTDPALRMCGHFDITRGY